MPEVHSRRRVLAGLSGIGATALLRTPAMAAEGPPETTVVRLPNFVEAGICPAPQYVVDELLRAEGFTDFRRVLLPKGVQAPDGIAQGMIDFGTNFASVQVAGIDRNVPMKGAGGCARRLLRAVRA